MQVFFDQAHIRSQYGFGGKANEKTGEMSSGFASRLRDALSMAPMKYVATLPGLNERKQGQWRGGGLVLP